MKNKNILKLLLACWIMVVLIITDTYSQPPAPPGENGLNGNQAPGGFAPVDGGIVFMLLGSAFYGALRVYRSLLKRRN